MSKPEKKTEDSVVRPLVHTGVVTEFGPVLEDPDARTFGYDQQVDVTYTPGWSELRRQRDEQLSEAAHGRRPPGKVLTLPGNVRLVRRTTVNGTPEMTSGIQHGNMGYRPITKDDVGQSWFTKMPGGAIALPDGSIAKGDCLYMYCPPEQAARNAAAQQQRTMDRVGATMAKAERHGIEATVTKEGDPIPLGSQISPTAVPRG